MTPAQARTRRPRLAETYEAIDRLLFERIVTPVGDVRDAYERWCAVNDVRPASPQVFNNHLYTCALFGESTARGPGSSSRPTLVGDLLLRVVDRERAAAFGAAGVVGE